MINPVGGGEETGMSYREENGQVILTMSREDYGRVVFALHVTAGRIRDDSDADEMWRTLHRLEASPSARCTPSAPPR